MVRMIRKIAAIIGGVLILFALSGISATADDSMPVRNMPMGGGPNKMMDSSLVDNLVNEGVITQDTADKIKDYLQEKEERKEKFANMGNPSEDGRPEPMERPEQGVNNIWAEMVTEGIITQSEADKIAELMPQRNEIPKQSTEQKLSVQQSTGTTSPSEIKVYINGFEKNFSPAPVNLYGSVLVPMRSFFEALGCEVEWYSSSQTAIGKKDGTEIKLPINQKTAYVNGQAKELTIEAKIINDSTYIPLRFVGEALGADVVWSNGSIIITQE